MTAGKINLNRVEPVLEARELNRLVSLFLAESDKRTADGTVYNYGMKLEHFTTWWESVGESKGWQIRPSDLKSFVKEYLPTVIGAHGKLLSFRTRNDVCRRLRQCFRWAYREHYTDQDYSVWVVTPEGFAPERTAPTLDDLAKLMNATKHAEYPLRDKTVIAVLIGTGLRRAELAGLDVEHITLQPDGSGTAVVHGKRVKGNATGRRQIAFDVATGEILRDYMKHYEVTTGPLFFYEAPYTTERVRLSTNAIYKIVKRAIERAGLADRLNGPHDLRRGFATLLSRYLLRNGGDTNISADMVRRQLGHGSFSMTAHYSKLDVEDIRESLTSPMAMLAARKRPPSAGVSS